MYCDVGLNIYWLKYSLCGLFFYMGCKDKRKHWWPTLIICVCCAMIAKRKILN